MKTNTLFQVRFRPSVKPPRGFTKSAHYNVLSYDWHNHKYLIGNTWLHASNFIKIKVEDAPVFQKPVLRKIASLKPDEVIECNTDAELKAVLEQAEREGLKWNGGQKPLEINPSTPACISYKWHNRGRTKGISWEEIEFHMKEKDTILPASKFVEVGTEGIQDLPISKYPIKNQSNPMFEQPKGEIAPPAPELKPFPKGYVIPEGTRVVALTDGGYSEMTCREGDVGTVVSESSVGGGYVDFDGRAKGGWVMRYKELAPLDPRDHPEHPEFGKNKQEEPITQAHKDECLKLQERIKELEALCELRLKDQEGLADEAESYREANAICIDKINRIESFAKAAIESNNDTLHKVALRAIANGEI